MCVRCVFLCGSCCNSFLFISQTDYRTKSPLRPLQRTFIKVKRKQENKQTNKLVNWHSIRNSSQTPANTPSPLLFSVGKGIMKIFAYCSPALNSSLSLISAQPRSPLRPLSHARVVYTLRDIFILSFPLFSPFPLLSPSFILSLPLFSPSRLALSLKQKIAKHQSAYRKQIA